MKTFKTVAIFATGLFLSFATCAAASAATITYTLTGFATGQWLNLSDPLASPHDFARRVEFELIGDTPGLDIGPVELIPIESGELTIGHRTLDLNLGSDTVFAINPLTGRSGFGTFDGSSFDPVVGFGHRLVGYDGETPLAPTHVPVNFLRPFTATSAHGKAIGFRIDDFVRGRFSASPEPASWALMVGGFAGAGAMLRRRRAVAA